MFEYAMVLGACVTQKLDYRSCVYVEVPEVEDYSSPIGETFAAFSLHTASNTTCRIDRSHVVYERNFAFDSRVLHAPPGSVISGYVQSWKYFHPHAEQLVRKAFTFPPAASARANAFLTQVRSQIPVDFKVIAVHVRAGDKVYDEKVAKHFDSWSLSMDYYKKALTLLTRRHPRSALLFFSGGGFTKEGLVQDRKFTKERFGNFSSAVFFDDSEDHFTSMKAMSLCDAIVVAHSSFSWWAAYLSETMEVVAPYHFFSPELEIHSGYVMEDYYLPWWSVLSGNRAEDRIVGWNTLNVAP